MSSSTPGRPLNASVDILPVDEKDKFIWEPARMFFELGVKQGRSAFSPSVQAWTSENLADLNRRVVEALDEGSGSFWDKLRGQLDGAGDETMLLAAELLTFMYLPVKHSISGKTKRMRIEMLLANIAPKVTIPPSISLALDYGAMHVGRALVGTNLWNTFSAYIVFFHETSKLDQLTKQSILDSPGRWSEYISRFGHRLPNVARQSLLYLRFPTQFVSIAGEDHRKRIRDAFQHLLATSPGDINSDLREIILEIQSQSNSPVNFYTPPLQERWEAPELPDGARRAWLVQGHQANSEVLVSRWLDEGTVSIEADHLPRLPEHVDPRSLRDITMASYSHLTYLKREERLGDFRSFIRTMSEGDILLTIEGARVFVGTVAGPSHQVELQDSGTVLQRDVRWNETVEQLLVSQLPSQLQALLSTSRSVTDLTQQFELVAELMTEKDATAGSGKSIDYSDLEEGVDVELPYLSEDVTDSLFVGSNWLRELIDMLNARKQVILYGPPGTGKTFIALKLAESIAPRSNVRLVQFHPSYSYEDFFEGYRPHRDAEGNVGFELKAGPLRRIVDDAMENRDQPYILIIDEINRGNLAKIFGELYFLLEYRDRAINLMYSEPEDPVFLFPKNIFIIGTMNSADRSIALVDAAMRRRFAFLGLHPSDDHVQGVLRSWLKMHNLDTSIADLVDELNSQIPDSDFAIGHAYLMHKSELESADGLERIWRTSILPQLEELHAVDDIDVKKTYGLDALRAAVRSKGSVPDDQAT